MKTNEKMFLLFGILLIIVSIGGKLLLNAKKGVDLSKRREEISKLDPVIKDIFNSFGIEPVITSTYDGLHMPTSYHYKNLAEDLRLPSAINKNISNEKVMQVLKEKIKSPYDIVLEGSHIHLEYDIKKA